MPNTGVTSNLAAIIFGSLLLVSSLLLVKSSKGRKLILLFVLGGTSIALATPAIASTIEVIGETKLFPISALNDITVPEIECYEYVGYIIPTVETTTVESTTSETVTTETTEATTIVTTTTEVETTTAQTETEVTVLPGTPSPP
mgnify:FL=1